LNLTPSPGNIFLIGYRGTGKTTVARLLAGRLDWDCVDADALLEATAGRTIRQIFAAEGEDGFRDRESAVLEEICRKTKQVVATGGGVVLRPENRDRLKLAGYVVWLSADSQTLWQRLQLDAATAERRPNLTSGGLEEIQELLAKREPLYRHCADLAVDTGSRTPEEVAAIIWRELSD
jgi:shikimate kinase